MPELPEVETTCRGIRPHLCGMRVVRVWLRESRLRWPVDPEIALLEGQMFHAVERRGKYLLLKTDKGCAIVHLGMSGSLRIVAPEVPLRKHDHVLIDMDSGRQLRFHDPRRFGSWLWSASAPLQHPLLQKLGLEPLAKEFNGNYLHQHCRDRKKTIKALLMDASVVVGVGNIYANEALFYAGIRPTRAAGKLSLARLSRLTGAIKTVLQRSIEQGGTTLRDFLREDGSPGYFRQQLAVYERKGQACGQCGQVIRHCVTGQRSTYFCPHCQR
jgi:formamidopyrimidine-DNA glycosylase